MSRSVDHTKGVADAIKVIKGMNRDWPCSVAPRTGMSVRSVAEEYQREFIMRILELYPDAEYL
jgi:hypothetical protein